LRALLEKPAEEWRSYIHGEHSMCYSAQQEMQFVTDGRFKFIWLPRIDVEQSFDLERDPGECVNLIDDPDRQGEIAQWRGYLVRELAARECGWVREGALVTPPDEPLVSPYKDVRWPVGRKSE
jgi:arylsulfatase